MPAAHIARRFEDNGLPYAPISKPEQLLDDPHLRATGGLVDVRLTDGERAGQTAPATLLPVRLAGERLGVRMNPPQLGEHTQELLSSLGYDHAAIAALRTSGAVAG